MLWIHKRMTEYCSAGFPHSDILGSMAAFASPGLFVDRYVLHRLPMPRHSPCALISLTFVRIMCPLVLVNFSTRLYCSVYPFQKINWIFVTLSRCFHFTFTCIQFSRYMVGLRGLEPPTSRLSGVRSNHLSYKPMFLIHSRESLKRIGIRFSQTCGGDKRDRTADLLNAIQALSRTIGYAPPDGLGKGLNIPPRQLMRDKLQYSIEGICCQLDIPLRYVPLAVVVARVRAYCAMGSS